MGKSELIIFAIVAALGLQEFYHKVTIPAIEQTALKFEDLYRIPYLNLFEELTEGYSTEVKCDLENKIDEFSKDSIFEQGMNYACKFRYLIPEENEELFLSLFAEEGFGRPDAVSPTGNHVGLGQLSETVAEEQGLRIIKKGKKGEEKIVYDERCIPYLNAKASMAYYDELYSKFGRHDLALLAYNHGPPKVREVLKEKRGVTAADILEQFNHREFNYLVKILGYSQHIDSKRYSVVPYNQLFERKQIKDEKSLVEVAQKENLSLTEFLSCNQQFRNPDYCKEGLFYDVPRIKTDYVLANTLNEHDKKLK